MKKVKWDVSDQEEGAPSVLGNRAAFIPELKAESITMFINLFNELGLKNIATKDESQQPAQPGKGGNAPQPKGAKGKVDPQQQQQEEKLVFTNENLNANMLAIFRFLHQKKYK